MADLAITAFGNGEVTPQIDARSDVAKYASSCRRLENMIPLVYGGVTVRPGLEFIVATKNGAGARLVPFVYSASIAYMCEFGNEYVRFFYDGAPVLDGSSTTLEIVSPYALADLPALQYRQVGDVLWICHPSYPQYQLKRTSATMFTLTAITFSDGPFLTRNDIANPNNDAALQPSNTVGSITLGVSAANWLTGVTYLAGNTVVDTDDSLPYTCTVALTSTTLPHLDTDHWTPCVVFQTGHIGALFSLTQTRPSSAVQCAINASNLTAGPVSILGSGTIESKGVWAGQVTLYKSDDGGSTWTGLRTWTSISGTPSNLQYAFNEPNENVQYKGVVHDFVTGSGTLVLTPQASDMTGIVRITAITNGHFATAMVLSPLASTTETKQWAEGSWSDINGYPAAVTFFNDRIIYGGTKKQPQVVWFSASDDFSNFFSGVIADQSFAVQIMATDDIVWLDALDVVCVGTSGGEWIITSNQLGNPITPDPAPTIRQIAAYGSNAVMPTRVANAVLFTDHMGRKVREFAFDQQRQSYEAPDLTVWAEHITTSGIVSMALQRNPDEILWACRADGTLLSMTYDRAQNIVAWARHPMVWAETYDPAAAATTSAYDAAVLADDLVAYWKLTESSGSVADSSGNSHGGYYQATGSTYPYSGNKPATVTLSFTNTPSGDWAGIASPMSLSFSGASWHWTDGFGLSIHLSWDPTSLPPALWRLEFRDIGIGSDYYAGVVAGGNFPFGQYVGSGQFTDVAITP